MPTQAIITRISRLRPASLAIASICFLFAPTSSIAGEDASPDFFNTQGHYTSKTPYSPRQSFTTYSAPPPGYQAVGVQHIARHGSRGLTSPDDDDLALQLWQQAAREEALTPLGRALGPVLEDILAAHSVQGYGRISELGVTELQEMGSRMVQRHGALFDAALTEQRRLAIHHSGRTRALQSAHAFVDGLLVERPTLAPLLDPPQARPDTVYFNKAEGSQDYQTFSDEDPRLHATINKITHHPRSKQMARLLLVSLFEDTFVDRLAAGEYQFVAAADADDQLNDMMDAAEVLFSLYSIAAGMPQGADWQFGRFIHPDAAAWFAYLDDAESFYERGPSFSDEDITWRGARALLEDMMNETAKLATEPQGYLATLRFSHAQALMPFAALLGIENASEALPADTLYSYASSPWRAADVSPMAANMQWDIYRNAQGELLIRMLHQERETRFAPSCHALPGHAYFYRFEELQRCYGYR